MAENQNMKPKEDLHIHIIFNFLIGQGIEKASNGSSGHKVRAHFKKRV